MNGRQRRILHDLDQRLLGQLQDRHEADHHAGTPLFEGEQSLEGREVLVAQQIHDRQHALTGRHHLTRDGVRLDEIRLTQETGQRAEQLRELHFRVDNTRLQLRQLRRGDEPVTPLAWHLVQPFGGQLGLLVLLQTPDQLGARVLFLVIITLLRLARQQAARLDLRQHGGHQQIFPGKVDLHGVHQLDVLDVLMRDGRDVDGENVEVLTTDEIQQQIQRPLEGLEKDPQCLRRDVEILRHLGERRVVDARQHGRSRCRCGDQRCGLMPIGQGKAGAIEQVAHEVSCRRLKSGEPGRRMHRVVGGTIEPHGDRGTGILAVQGPSPKS